MPRKIGYGNFTPARRAALKKAQLESARKRRKFRSEDRPVRRVAKAEESTKRRTSKKKLLAYGAAAAAGIAAGFYANKKANEYLDAQSAKDQREYEAMVAAVRQNIADREKANKDAASEEAQRLAPLKAAAGNVLRTAESQEQYDARVALYGQGQVIGEYSQFHGRPEIFPTIPLSEASRAFVMQQVAPSYRLEQDNPDEDYVVLYHRTGGGKDLDGQKAKASILQNQSMQVLNRDEKRAVKSFLADEDILQIKQTWWSNRLNDSNTRAAFGEHVVKIKFPKSKLAQVSQQSFGELTTINEVWAAIPQDVINEVLKTVKVEDVTPDEIKPPPERKFRAPQ